MAKRQALMLVLVAATLLVGGELPAVAVDDVWLRNGGRLGGDLDDADLVLLTAQGPYRVTRERVWRLVLDSGTGDGDSVELRSGNRLTGRLDRGRYGLRLAGGETRMLNRGEIQTVTLGAPRAAGESRLTDVVILTNGDHVSGDVSPSDFEIAIPSGTHRFGRDAVWQIDLDSNTGDTIRLTDGARLSGIVEQPRYDVRTPDGQVVSFARSQVKAVVLAPPARPRAAAAPGSTTAAMVTPAPAAAPTPTDGQAAALPPAIRAVLRDLHFEFDRWELTPEARRALDELAAGMKAYPRLGLVVEGHADERGTSEYNLALGSRRAQSARDYLVSLGIEPERVETMSYGEERPLDPAHTEMAWALNRRAHFVVKAP
jgi:peptidoglycan-associated lipoprotein